MVDNKVDYDVLAGGFLALIILLLPYILFFVFLTFGQACICSLLLTDIWVSLNKTVEIRNNKDKTK